MPLTNAGRDYLGKAIAGLATPAFNAANAFIAVGDSAAAFAVTQTDLQGAVNITNKIRKGMDSTYPQNTNNVNVYRSTFGPTEANFAWNEWAVLNASSAGTMLNRQVEYNGTKLSGQTWIFEVTLTVNIGT